MPDVSRENNGVLSGKKLIETKTKTSYKQSFNETNLYFIRRGAEFMGKHNCNNRSAK